MKFLLFRLRFEVCSSDMLARLLLEDVAEENGQFPQENSTLCVGITFLFRYVLIIQSSLHNHVTVDLHDHFASTSAAFPSSSPPKKMALALSNCLQFYIKV